MTDKNSYLNIFKNTSIIGFAQILHIIFSVLRAKAVAVILGPSGVGYIGIFQSIIDIVRNSTGFGINISGVKEVSRSRGQGKKVLARRIIVLRRLAMVTGLLGVTITILFSNKISLYSFGDEGYSFEIIVLSFSIFFSSIAAVELALLQGIQRIKCLAKAQVLSGLVSTIAIVPIYYFFGIESIPYTLVIISVVSLLISLKYTRSIHFEKELVSNEIALLVSKRVVRLGVALVINSVIASGLLFSIRYLINSELDMDSVGLFQVSYTITSVYVGLILNAMLSDFLPRLSSHSSDNKYLNRATNEQARMAMIMGAPIICLLMILSPFVLRILYSEEFVGASEILTLRLYSFLIVFFYWPIGVIMLAKGKGSYSVLVEFFSSVLNLLSVVFLWQYYDLLSTSIACVISAILALFLTLFLANKLSGFRCQMDYIRLSLVYFILASVVLILVLSLGPITSLYYSIPLLLIVSAVSFNKLDAMLGIKKKIKSRCL